MNAHTQKAELEQSSENLLLQLFNERIIGAQTLGSGKMYLSAQFNIKRFRSEVLRFIKEHPYSYFHVNVLSARDELNLDRPVTGILVRNFQLFLEGNDDRAKPREFMIAIHPNWTEARYFSLSLTGLRISETIG